MKELATMPKYEAYKDSGVEWLGDIPEGWKAIKMKFLYQDTSIKNKASETLLSVTQNQGVVPRTWVESRMVMPSGNLESFKFIEEGDFAISLRSFEGGLEYCHHDGIISPAYTVLKAKKRYLLRHYYKYLFKSQAFISELQTSIVGIREGKNISYEELRYSLLPIPDENEQTAIANFLDKKTAQIDEAIAIKQQQIELLKERKQIIIQQAVTQGLDTNVPMKDSGVDWIGQIPEHWEVTRLKHLFTEVNKRTKTGEETLYSLRMEIGLIPHDDVSDKEIKDEHLVDYKKVTSGQIVMNRMRASIGIFGLAYADGLVSPDYAIFDISDEVDSEYFLTLFKLPLLGTQFRLASRGMGTGSSGFMRLYTDSFGQLKVPFPPKEEQEILCKKIQDIKTETENSIGIFHSYIEKLKEYKTTLINSAVTGKIKVPQDISAGSEHYGSL
ncbi:restriction endonuclease subunit S [Parashewanella curva]|uniref:Restriction endonuclease subunit S n=1 Tax=Parashewanella curva TaxID=2338552 RepID=A0A3L8Q0E9_9GAMM|nr:restriction endonuclease subunit S [Parashewanella curva]RLV60499.1 restriction endonuclease subunit S [Parashewanella curva]